MIKSETEHKKEWRKRMFNEIVAIILDYCEMSVEEISESSYLIQDLGLNSIDMVNIVVLIEEKYNIEIPFDDVMRFQIIRDVIRYMEEKVNIIK